MTSTFESLTDGIEFGLDGERLCFADTVRITQEGHRTVGAMSSLYRHVDPADEAVLYDTFYDVRDEADEDRMLSGKLAYSLTSIRQAPVGTESAKTHGHVHSFEPDGFPPAEAYEVLSGSGVFFLQDLHAGPASRMVVAVHAEKGDVVVIPGGLYHCSVNAGEGRLVFADLCRRGMSDVYGDVREFGGFAYLRHLDGEYEPNPRYADVAGLKHVTAEEWAGGRIGSLYTTLRDDPAQLAWLWDRDEFVSRFPHLAEYAYPVGLAQP
ncbi:glucose-6-phosphate isomerase family protein [Microbacterium sp.]|uniref:glucose-6-phosphate isomerase family protein n=1 Tax=Microbacterium sp. TaxID=51671 RepID=UPI0039E5422B